jgi:predicted nucleotidyltransferase
MGSNQTTIADALFSGVQQRLLALIFGQPDRSFYTNELLRLAGTGRGALQRELEKLASSGLVTLHCVGNQKHYQANRAAPVFEELRGIVLKTFGLTEVLRAVLADLGERIQLAFVYGSVAKGADTAASDIDVMVVGDEVTYGDLFERLSVAESTLGRKVNPTLYSRSEFQRKRQDENHFVTRVLSQPKLFLKGGEDEFGA